MKEISLTKELRTKIVNKHNGALFDLNGNVLSFEDKINQPDTRFETSNNSQSYCLPITVAYQESNPINLQNEALKCRE